MDFVRQDKSIMFPVSSAEFWDLPPIVIDDLGYGDYTWEEAALQEWCSGSGDESSPYVIENVTINAASGSHALYINNTIKYFKVQNCTLYGAGAGMNYAGLILNNCSNGIIFYNNLSNNVHLGIYATYNGMHMNITSNIISNCGNGIYFISSNYSSITYNNISNCATSNHIYLYNTRNNSISNNKLNYSSDGSIRISCSWNTSINKNQIYRAGYYGVSLESSPSLTNEHNIVTENSIDECVMGINLDDTDNNKILRNKIYNATTFSGIKIYRSNYNLLESNEIKNCTPYGIFQDYTLNLYCIGNQYINNNISQCETGMYMEENSDLTNITGNIISNTNMYGIYFERSERSTIADNKLDVTGSDAIHIKNYCSQTNIFNNRITNSSESGIYLWVGADYSMVENNLIKNCSVAGIEINSGLMIDVQNNEINNCTNGIKLLGALRCTFSENLVSNCDMGIFIQDGTDYCMLNRNLINDNEVGIRIQNADYSEFFENLFQDNKKGIGSESSNKYLKFYQNYFVDNIMDGEDNSTLNDWYYENIGNYYNGYDGVDANNDYIGDTAVSINGVGGKMDLKPIWDDNPPVFFSEPTNKSYEFSEQINFIDWVVIDPTIQNPTYSLYINDILVKTNQLWESSESISYVFKDLEIGTYVIRIEITDGFPSDLDLEGLPGLGGVLIDEVTITIIPDTEERTPLDPWMYILIGIIIGASVAAILFLYLNRRKIIDQPSSLKRSEKEISNLDEISKKKDSK